MPVKQISNAIYIAPIGPIFMRDPDEPIPSSYLGDIPYADDGNRGLPDWFFTPPSDYFFFNIEIYDNGQAEWTGGMGVVWRLPGGAKLDRHELGRLCDAWCKENL